MRSSRRSRQRSSHLRCPALQDSQRTTSAAALRVRFATAWNEVPAAAVDLFSAGRTLLLAHGVLHASALADNGKERNHESLMARTEKPNPHTPLSSTRHKHDAQSRTHRSCDRRATPPYLRAASGTASNSTPLPSLPSPDCHTPLARNPRLSAHMLLPHGALPSQRHGSCRCASRTPPPGVAAWLQKRSLGPLAGPGGKTLASVQCVNSASLRRTSRRSAAHASSERRPHSASRRQTAGPAAQMAALRCLDDK
jgi:hypothetical protein